MAKITFTTDASVLARTQLAEFPQYDEPMVPVLTIRWSRGTKENRRGPNGEVIWETIEPPGWLVEVAAWGESKTASVLADTIMIDGIRVPLDHKASTAIGGLMVTVRDGKLSVTQLET